MSFERSRGGHRDPYEDLKAPYPELVEDEESFEVFSRSRPLDREHVVGEVDAEAGVGEDLGQPSVVHLLLGERGADLHGAQFSRSSY